MRVRAGLTENQKACLRLVAKGMTSKEIAVEVGLSPSTVDTYLKAAAATLGASNRRDAARRLLDEEKGAAPEPQELGYQSQGVVEPAGVQDGSGAPAVGEPPVQPTRPAHGAGLFKAPPVGGSDNELGAGERVVEVVKIACLLAVAMTALILFALGALKVLT